MPDRSFDLVIAPAPFTDRVETASVPAGTTIAQMLVIACEAAALDPQDLGCTDIYINGVLFEDRHTVLDFTPADGDVINVVVMPQGGHGGAKALETALQVAIMVAAFAIAGPAGTPLATALAGAQITGSLAAGISMATMAAIDITGSLALTAIFGNLTSTTATSPTYNLTSQTNQARQRQPMPLQCGQARVALDVAASAYTTISGDDQFVTAAYAGHFGPCTMTDIKIGETLAAAYPADELTIEYFLIPGVARTTSLYPNKIDQQSFQNELDPLHSDYTTETTGIEPCTQFEVDLYWPALYYTSSGGAQENEQGRILIEYSPHGANSWSPVPGLPAGTDKSNIAYPSGTYYVVANTRNPIRVTHPFTLPSGQYDIRMSRNVRPGGNTSRDTDDVYWTALRSIDASQPAIADTTLSVIFLRAKASQDFDGTLGVVTAVVTPITPLYDAASGEWLGDPTNLDSSWAPTSNAAAIARYCLTGYPAAVPLLPSEIDPSFGDHYSLIETMGWTGALSQTSAATQSDLLKSLGKLGRCTFYWNGASMCAVPDYEKPEPRQLFTGRNAKSYSYKRLFPDPIHAVWVQFANSDEDWLQDGLFVYADGFDAASASLLETLTLEYATTGTRAYKEGRVYLAKRQLLTETHQWNAGIESVASYYGHRVKVRHNSIAFGIGEARVLFRRFSGALISGVRLDAAMTFGAGAYAMDARLADQVVGGIELTTTPGMTRDIVFATPMAADQAPLPGNLVAIGEVSIVTEDVELIDVIPQADGTARMIAQAYRWDDIIAAETGAVPALQSLLTARQAAPVPIIQGAQGSPSGVAVAFTVDPQRQAAIKGFSVRYRRSPSEDASSSWTTLQLLPPGGRVAQTPAIKEAQYQPGDTDNPYQVDVEIRTVLTTGETSQPAQALNIVVDQGVYAPVDFTALGVVRTGMDGSSYPVIAISCDPLTSGSTSYLDVELQPAGANPPAWVASGSSPFHADNPVGDLTDVLGGVAYDVRAKFRTSDNWVSAWVEADSVTPPDGSLVSANTANVGGRTVAQANADLDAALGAVATAEGAADAAQGAVASAQSAADSAEEAAAAAAGATGSAQVAGQAALASAVQQAQQFLALHALNFNAAGIPNGPLISQQQVVQDDQVSTLDILLTKTPDGTGVILNSEGVYNSDGTLLSQKLVELSSATDAVSATLSDAYLTAAQTNLAISTASETLQAAIAAASATLADNYLTSAATNDAIASASQTLQAAIAGVSATLSDNYLTSAQTNDAIASASQTLQAAIASVSATLSDNYLTSAATNEAIASASQTLQAAIASVSATLSDNYLTSAATNEAIASASQTLQAAIAGVSATLSDNYLTSAQTNDAIASASQTLQAAIASVSATLSDNYLTSAATNEAIASASQTLQAAIASVSATLSDNYLTSAATNDAIASASQTLQAAIAGVSATLSDNYLTSAQTNDAIASMQETLQSGINGVEATASLQAGAITTLNGKTTAYFQETTTTPGGAAVFSIYSEGSGTGIVLDADDIYLGSGWVFDKASKTQQFNSGSYMKVTGGPFGSANQFVAWNGPPMALSSMTEANGVSWEKVDGSAYFGGGLSAGTLTTKAATSDTSASAVAETAVFGSNGGAITVVLSYSYSSTNTSSSGVGTHTTSGSDGATYVDLYRGVNGGALSLVTTLAMTGAWTLAVEPGYTQSTDTIAGSLTYTDPDRSTENRQYEAVLRTRSTTYSSPIIQRLSVICTEG